MTPERIQLRRAKGWRMPPNTIKVDRTTKFGNPFVVGPHGTRDDCVRLFTHLCAGYLCVSTGPGIEAQREYVGFVKRNLTELRGRNLACWCPPGQPCHADVLLRIAND
jgi:hypothetical protein